MAPFGISIESVKTDLHFPRLLIIAGLFLLVVSLPLSGLEYPDLEPVDDDKQQEKLLLAPELYLDKAIDSETYIVGPGDVFLITFYGGTQEPIYATILPEGIVAIPSVGKIKLGQITLSKAKERILEQLRLRYRDREIGVSLHNLRLFKVSVAGAVGKPGMIIVSASDRVSEAIKLAGGLQEKASRRNIKLAESEGDTSIADLDYFRASGDLDSDPYLHEGQVIFVPIVSDSFDKIEVYGAVNAPDTFEYRPGDRISDLLTLGFGLSPDADLKNGELLRFDPETGELISIPVDCAQVLANPKSPVDLLLLRDDRLFIRAMAGYHEKETVKITGEVKFPGDYPIQDGCRTLSELVTKAGGLRKDASLSEAEMYVRRQRRGVSTFDQLLQLSADKLTDFELQYLKASSAGRPGKIAVNFKLLFEEKRLEYDVPLHDGDLIRIPKKSYSVTVLGRVVNPGQVPYKEDANLDYYIRFAGGFGYKADKKNIQIIKPNTGSLIKPSRKMTIEMGDRIMVPQTEPTDWWGLFKDAGFFLANLATIYVVIDQAVN